MIGVIERIDSVFLLPSERLDGDNYLGRVVASCNLLPVRMLAGTTYNEAAWVCCASRNN